MLKIKNSGTKGEIYIWGNIIDDSDANWLKADSNGKIVGYEFPSNIKAQLDALKGIPIDVHIASDGGSVSAGIAIYNMLANHDAEVNVYIDNWAASIASFIAFSGKKIFIPSNCFLMVHNPTAGVYGTAEYMISVADYLEKLQNMIAETYAKHIIVAEGSEKTAMDIIKDLMDAETWLTAKDAAELFDNVELLEANEIKAVAEFKSTFKSAPKNLLPKTKDEEEKTKIINVLREAYKL